MRNQGVTKDLLYFNIGGIFTILKSIDMGEGLELGIKGGFDSIF
jgi:hypothetical protein